MRIKHTYLFTMLVGLVWVGLLFGYQNGPAQNGAGVVDGVFTGITCNQSGCHNSFPLNSGGGTLTLAGLPAQWSPGVTYPLIITVQKSGALIYGFQISAVYNSSNPPRSAGTLSKGKTSGTDATRISVFTEPASGIQVVEHNAINASLAATTTYFVNWTAPPDTSGGSVRFNLAGNAGNRDQQPTGDFIYTFSQVVAPAASAPPDFALSASVSSATINAGGNTSVGITVTPANGFNGSVSLAVTGLPSGATGSFDTSTVSGSGTANLTISTTAAVAPGTYPLTITATSGALSHSANFSLTVAAPVGSPSQSFTIANFASNSSSTDGSGNLAVGYSTIQATGGTTPSGVEIFGFRANNILVSETGVPASPLISAGRLYAETTGAIGTPGTVNTGLAIANPNGQTANLNVFFTDSTGVSTAAHPVTIAAGNQIAAFLIQAPFADPSITGNFQGTFSFTSSVPVSVIALRGFTNERGEFLISTLPVIDTTAAAASGTQFLPHFAAGLGWTTQVILINPGTTTLSGSLQFIAGATGKAASVTIGTQVTGTAPYSIAGGSSQKIIASGAVAGQIATGSVQVVPSGGGAAPVPLVVFSYKPAAFTVAEAGAPSNAGTAFRMYVQSSGVSGQPGNIQSGIAVANTSATTAANVTFELFNPDGSSTGITPASVSIPPSEQVAEFLAQIFQGQNLPQPFQGVLRISSTSAAISVVGLRGRYNERSDFLITTTPPTLESGAASSAELLFPHFVNGGGYTTQFILFSGIAGQTSSGALQFFDQKGNPLPLSLQ
jgi:hypothetical protein